MSNLLEQASLVMIPSGYKEDVVYSEIPLNGAGDLSFTRASDGTRINSQGLVEVVPWNLNTNSNDFATGWVGANRALTVDATTAPNGTTTADQLGAIGGTAYYAKYITSPIGSYTFSVFLKYGNRQYQQIYGYAGTAYFAEATFDLQNGTVYSIQHGNASIENVGGGWYRCSIYGTTIGTSIEIGIESIAVSTYTYAWGAQLNIGSTAKPYFPTTDRLNVPRLTYQNGGGGCPSLLLEKQSTNVITYSEEFDNAAWNKIQISATANNTSSPDGTQNADLITTTATGVCYTYELVTGTSGAYSASIYAKNGNNNYLALNIQNSLNNWVTSVFDLSDGSLGEYAQGSGGGIVYVNHTITPVGNGWYRCVLNYTTNQNSYYCPMFAPLKTGNSFTSAYGEAQSNANNKTLYLWGAQLEASSYATSYIPTTSSSATRVADAFALKDITSFSIGNAYTILLDVTMQSSDNNKLFFETRTSTNATSLTARNFNGALRLFNNIDASYPLAAVSSSTNKWVVRINGTSYDLFAVSGGIATKDSATITTARNFGYFELAGSTTQLYFDELVIFPTALTDAECQSLVL